jgi:hypothetical protein
MDNIETPSLAECLPRVPPRTRRSRLVFPNPRQATEPKRRQLQLAKHTRRPHERDLAETHRDSEVRGARDLRHEDREREDGGEQHDLCGEPHGAADARIRVSDQNAARCTRGNVSTVHPRPPASDEDHASAGARSAPASLLHPRKAAATGSLSPSMQLGRAGGYRPHPRRAPPFVTQASIAEFRHQTLALDEDQASAGPWSAQASLLHPRRTSHGALAIAAAAIRSDAQRSGLERPAD